MAAIRCARCQLRRHAHAYLIVVISQLLPEEGDSGCIWNAIHHANIYKLLEGASVIDLKFKLFIAEIEKLLKNKHLEKNQQIKPLASRVALPLLRVTFLR